MYNIETLQAIFKANAKSTKSDLKAQALKDGKDYCRFSVVKGDKLQRYYETYDKTTNTLSKTNTPFGLADIKGFKALVEYQKYTNGDKSYTNVIVSDNAKAFIDKALKANKD